MPYFARAALSHAARLLFALSRLHAVSAFASSCFFVGFSGGTAAAVFTGGKNWMGANNGDSGNVNKTGALNAGVANVASAP